MPDYLKIPEVARRLDVSEKTARRMVKSAKLPSVFVGGAYRVSEDDLAEYLEGAKVWPGGAGKDQPPLPEVLEGGEWQRRLRRILELTREASRLRKRWAEEIQGEDMAENRAIEISFAISGIFRSAESPAILGGIQNTDRADAEQVEHLREELEQLRNLHWLAVEPTIRGLKFKAIMADSEFEQASTTPAEPARRSHA